MKDFEIVHSYTFNATTGTITFTALGSIDIEDIQVIRNITTNQLLYASGVGGYGGSVTGNVLTLQQDLSELSLNTDDLQIYRTITVSTGTGTATWGAIDGNIEDEVALVENYAKRVYYGIAGEAISSGMAVVIWTDGQIYKYNISNENHAGLTCGIAKTSASVLGDGITIVLPGNFHIEVGSGWQAGKSYFVSATSLLTETAPTGLVKKIATGIAPDTVLINDYNEFITI